MAAEVGAALGRYIGGLYRTDRVPSEIVLIAHSLGCRVVLEGFSRGGLYAFNFAATHPTRVAALYLDAPVLDDHRYLPHRQPAHRQVGRGDAEDQG